MTSHLPRRSVIQRALCGAAAVVVTWATLGVLVWSAHAQRREQIDPLIAGNSSSLAMAQCPCTVTQPQP